MNFFGMGIPELLVIMILALILFGPGKLPEIMQGIGRAVREFRAATQELTSEFEQALREVQSTTAEVTSSVLTVQEETKAALGEVASATQEVTRQVNSVVADQAPAPVTAPAATVPSRSTPPSSEGTSPAAQLTAVVNGRREASKDDPLADLVGLDVLIDEAVPNKAATNDSADHWER